MRDITTAQVLTMYESIRYGEIMKAERAPIIDFILAHRNCDRFTVCELGEELMGKDAYHAKFKYWSGAEADFRTMEAREMTGRLTQALRKLCKMGVLERHEEKDKTKLIEFECDGYVYCDRNGNQLPEQVELKLADGTPIMINVEDITGVKRTWGRVTRKVYPKVVYYTFVK